MKINFVKLAQIVSAGIIIILLIYALFSYFGPFGSTKLSIVFNKNKLPTYVTEITGLETPEKNLKTGQTYRRVSNLLAKLKIKVFKTFKKINVKLRYENQNTNFVLASIALKSPFKNARSYKTQTRILENKLFDDLDWYKIADKNQGKILYQKGDDICKKKVDELKAQGNIDPIAEYENCAAMYDKDGEYLKEKNSKKNWVNYEYEDLNGFMSDMPNLIQNERLCYFNIDGLIDKAVISDYSPASETSSFDYAIKGFLAIKTYLSNENFDFNFDYQDLNTLKGKSDFKIFVFKNDQKILEKNISDDGNENADAISSDIKNLSITITDLPAGQYKIYLDANDDIIFNSISTKQKYWAFIDNVNLFDSGKEVNLYSNSGRVNFEALNDSSLQTITITKEKGMVTESGPEFSDKKIDISKTDKTYSFNRNIYSRISLPKADLNISFNNLISPDIESLQKLSPSNLVDFSDFASFNEDSCNYIISDYFERPNENNGIITASADFNVNDLFLDENKNFSLLLGFPEYNRNDDSDVKINRIDLTYSR